MNKDQVIQTLRDALEAILSDGPGRAVVIATEALEDTVSIEPEVASDLESALDARYPIPDSPHQSVITRASNDRCAFENGWNAALAARIEPAEPVAWMWQHDETGRTGFVDMWQVENGWIAANPRLKLITLLYAAPPPIAQPSPDWRALYEEALAKLIICKDGLMRERIAQPAPSIPEGALLAAIRREIDHAHINAVRTTPDFGRMEGHIAVRVDFLEAAIAGCAAAPKQNDGGDHVEG